MNTIPSALIAAMLPCAGKNDIRHYINSVFIEPRDGKAIVVSTDGHVLCAVHTALDWNLGSIIIPRDVCEQLAKMKGDIAFSAVDDARRFAAVCGSSTINFVAIDDRYPDWRAVVPGLLEQAPAAFAPSILNQVVKSAQVFAKEFGDKKTSGVVLRPASEGAMLAAVCGIIDARIDRIDYLATPLRVPAQGAIDPDAARA